MMNVHSSHYNFGNTENYYDLQSSVAPTRVPSVVKVDDVETYNLSGMKKAQLGQLESAIADFDMAIRLQPNNAIIYYNRGTAKHVLGEDDSAIADFDMAIRL